MKLKESQYLTQSDFNEIIRIVPNLSGYRTQHVHVKLSPEQFRLLFKLMYYCGLKTTEVLGLTKSDFDLPRRSLKIKLSTQFKYKPQETTIPPVLIDELQNYLDNKRPADKLFVVTRSTVWRYIKEAGHLANLKLSRFTPSSEVRGGDTFLFRDSLRHIMTVKGADKLMIALKLRDSDARIDLEILEKLKSWEERNFPRPSYSQNEIQTYVDWFEENYPLYQALENKAKHTVEELLESKNITSQTITSRTKSVSSFRTKLENGIKYNPKEMQDLVAIRIIANVKSEVEKIGQIIKENFNVNEALSIDKFSELLNTKEIGYQSKHLVVKFPKERTNLPEYRKFSDIQFEIQIRTILQHAWAEIEHDRSYKSPIKLPKHLERSFNLLAASLELVDNQFEQIISEIDKHAKETRKKKIGGYTSMLNADLLSGYLIANFIGCSNVVREFSIGDRYSNLIINELKSMGIETIDELTSIFNVKLREAYLDSKKEMDFVDILRHMMIIYDAEKYFSQAWTKNFVSLDQESQKILEKCGVNLSIVGKYVGLK